MAERSLNLSNKLKKTISDADLKEPKTPITTFKRDKDGAVSFTVGKTDVSKLQKNTTDKSKSNRKRETSAVMKLKEVVMNSKSVTRKNNRNEATTSIERTNN